MKKVLVIGGTLFIGRCLVEKLIQDSSISITLFNRGRTNPGLFPDVRRIHGDRETSDIDQITCEDWDCIIDISCYFPNGLRELIPKLKGRVGRYILVSTVSSYALEDSPSKNVTEEHELIRCSVQEAIDTSGRTYGKRKAECDRILLEADWLDKIIIRPSIVYGKYDSTWRLYYWLYRINLGVSMILPNDGVDRSNYTYVEDLASILVESMSIENHSITYNVSTHPIISFKDFLTMTASLMGEYPQFIAVKSKKLEREQIHPENDVPLWLNGSFMLIDNSKLLRDFSVELVNFETSLSRTVEYYKALEWPAPQIGMGLKQERELLEKLV